MHDVNQGGNDLSAQWEAIIAAFLRGEYSVLEFIRSFPSNDYEAFVQQARRSLLLLRDPRIQPVLAKELSAKLQEASVDEGGISKMLKHKDAARRFKKLVAERANAVNTQPSLLTATEFSARLIQYQSLISHVENRWLDACVSYERNDFPFAAFLSILVIEEVGKLSRLAEELVYFDGPSVNTNPAMADRNHRRKHFIAVMSGALINARLDRVLGKDIVRKILHEAESGELEKIRQACLYIDMVDGRAMIPSERIDERCARDLTVLAGELMAEVLGHFPWEFERLIERVVAFEQKIGLPEAAIARR